VGLGFGFAGNSVCFAADVVPVMVRSAPGRVEVAARDASEAHAFVALAEETWRLLAAPFGLPNAFSSPVFVRLLDEPESVGHATLEARVEAGGVVSIWIRRPAAAAEVEALWRRGLVRGLLLRLAVSWHGADERLMVPYWLETSAMAWCVTRAHPARLDEFKYESETVAPPAIDEVFMFSAASTDRRRLEIAALWLLAFLQGESSRDGEWPGFLRGALKGEAPAAALAGNFPGRYNSAQDRELWWHTGWHHLRRVRTLPSLDAAESRVELAQLGRFVFAHGDTDVVLSLRTIVDYGADVVVGAEIKRRSAEVGRLTAGLHPFYRNAGLSLAAALESASGPAAKRDAACAQFDQDWRDAIELERASQAALDALERKKINN
jgi:hypothetical protein